MRVLDLIKILAEIINIPEGTIEFTDGRYNSHYIRTSYAYQPKLGRKYIPPTSVDLGQRLLQIIGKIDSQ
jgi:UDP-glucose 4-epimerase